MAIDRLPLATREDMLEGIERHPIIVGADGNLSGGVCPIFAASRPTSKRHGRPFARAWDRYARAKLPRAATERELLTLRSMLETSIQRDTEPPVSLSDAITAHKVTKARNEASRAAAERDAQPVSRARPDTGERDRTDELSGRHGWAWLRPYRRYDDYESALRLLEDMQQERRGSQPEELELATN